MPFTEDEVRTYAKLYEECGKNIAEIVRKTGMPETSVRRRLQRAAEKGLLGFKPVLPGFALTKTTSTLDGDGNVTSQTVSQRREPEGEDGEPVQFVMPKGHILGRGTFNVDADGNLKQAWLKTQQDDQLFVEAVKEAFQDLHGAVPLIPCPVRVDDDLLSIYPIADQHNGLLAWGKETGEAYDLKIGEARLRACAARLMAQSPNSKYAIILNLGDWQHNDDAKNRTPAHQHILDVDSRYRKILVAGVKLMKDIITMALQKHEVVIVVNIPGNHDPHASIALDVAMLEAYADNPRVTVWDADGEITKGEFWFHEFGKTLLGATHGHRCKPQDMAMTMAVRQREAWGRTAYRYFYFGHIHHETVKEIGDVRVESFQTLAANDAHHEASGYTSGKSLTSITIHRQDGEIGRHRVNMPAPQRQAQQFDDVKKAA